ncbi:hypothetical protein LWI29_033213 [Acer saccharum]|uniref:Uncharacterized protein n=1 Tax=Acer saccharum TaxID=4024 RepID=A0AA39VM48_ACESA|nr:hypothetical protein LWI29_033213 [Acer saccharum]KAK1562391.1 hypothetical protein Q3G72_011131 [Acer saccharum]KAK1563713.1 hypothetical protein Q3G72_031627 [Acer saccharum]
MAGNDTNKQFMNLIRDFASEKSHGERRVVGLKQRIKELESELEAVNAELEEAKRFKETTEQELKGFEVELALIDNGIQALESRISLIQEEISAIGFEVEALKNEQGALRDGFISQMYQLNAKIRAFQRTWASDFQKDNSVETAAESNHNLSKKEVTEVNLTTLENMLADIVTQTAREEKEYLEEENIQKQVQLELNDLEKKIFLMEAIMEETKALQDLTRYPCQQVQWLMVMV